MSYLENAFSEGDDEEDNESCVILNIKDKEGFISNNLIHIVDAGPKIKHYLLQRQILVLLVVFALLC